MKVKYSKQWAVRSSQFLFRSYTVYCALLTAYCALFLGCAQIVTPDGGPKDTEPPHAIKYSPDSAATNFHGTKIVITFDEYIALNDLNKQLIISPAVKRRPEVTIRRKDLVIQFKDTLEPNTTYSISFGKSIRDITENNVLNNFRYVFSTGPLIDSLKCSGQIVNAQTLRGEKNVLVMLYRNTNDSVPYKEKPYYYTRTDDNGNFLMTNLAAGKYKLFALADEGEDYLFNSTDERIAFSDSLLTLDDDADSIRMVMFREKPTMQKLNKSAQLSPGRFRFEYNLSVENPSVSYSPALPETMESFVQYSEFRDTIDIWLSRVEIDSVQFIINSGATHLDEVPMKLDKPGVKKSLRAGTTDSRTLRIQHNTIGGKLMPGHKFAVTGSNPIRRIDTSRIVFTRGLDTLDPKLILSDTRRNITFDVPFPEDSSYSVIIYPGAFIDWFGQKNDTLKTTFTVQPARQFGNLSIKIPTLKDGNYLLEVVDEKDRVLRDTVIHGASLCQFNLMAAGNYRIRLIHDANGDGRWTAGNYPEKKQPERVIYYNTSVRIRAGWDMDVEWRME